MKKKCKIFISRIEELEKRYQLKRTIISIFLTIIIIFLFTLVFYGYYRVKLYREGHIVFNDRNFEIELQKQTGKTLFFEDDLLSIHELRIADNKKISDLSDLDKFENLKRLTVSGCNVTAVPDIKGLDQLVYLDLSRNLISSLEGIEDGKQLEQLYLANNYVSDISLLYELYHIETLDLSSNNISTLSTEITKLNKLGKLILNDNRLISIDEVSGLTGLFELSVASNKITEEPNLINLFLLEKLMLQDNSLREIETLGDLSNLRELDISNNYLDDLTFVYQYDTLETLNISFNQYKKLDGIQSCQMLKCIDIRGTNITDVSVLKNLSDFCEIYVDEEFNREQLDFMIGNFYNADKKTKKYLIGKQNDLE
ncbi:Leucine-rich repeat (LRR) protein [Lachnospiraceae bacterium PF1-22]|uniref:leucine-rich repeat domain-containing protein n=1 Tax=Ohessyouella blattaphilus TaxID=2949333 RepID=UPI003E1904AC